MKHLKISRQNNEVILCLHKECNRSITKKLRGDFLQTRVFFWKIAQN